MIHTSRTVTVGKMESVINEPIMLYRGDREVEIEFNIVGSKFMFSNGGNVIKSTNATNGQLVINTPTGENMFSEVTECNDGKVVCVITKEMIDELAEVGFYSFQIRLFDESQVSRVTIPPVYQGIEIRNPIAAEDETDLVDIGLVDFSVVRKDNYENVVTFLPNGDYNKTLWEEHDVISKDRLNKVEDALYEINKGTEGLYPTFQNQYDEFSAKVNKDVKAYKEEMEDEVEQFERDMTQAFGEFKVDYKDEVHDRLDEIAISVKSFGVKGDGINDDTQSIIAALNIHKSLYFPKGDYLITDSLVFDKHYIKMHKEARILKGFDGVGVFIVGGAGYTHLEDFKIIGYGSGLASSESHTEGHGIAVLGCRVNFNNVTSSNHKGHGVVFVSEPTTNSGFTGIPAYSCNMNKCIIENLSAASNDGHGIFLKGTQDDMSVWRCSFYTTNNRGNGVIFDADCTARDFDGFIYSENDGLNNTTDSHNIVFDGIRCSRFSCYAEGQYNKNAKEILCAENSSVEVFSMRANRDINYSNSSVIKIATGTLIKRLASTNNNALSDIIANGQIISPNLSGTMFYDTNVLFNGEICNTTRVRQNTIQNLRIDTADNTAILEDPNSTYYFGSDSTNTKYKANGNINERTNVAVGDILYSQIIRGYHNEGYRAGGKIEYVVAGVGSGKLGVNIIFYIANMENKFTEAFRISYNGTVTIPKLAGDGDRTLMVDKNGTLKTN